MNAFQSIQWNPKQYCEKHVSSSGEPYTTAHWVISNWHIPFTFEDWLSKLEIHLKGSLEITDIYEYCATRCTRPECQQLIRDSSKRLYCDPGHVKPFEKMASFYILRLLASVSRSEVWKIWPKVPKTDHLLKDEIFCLCVVALHPVLYGRLHPISRNNRRVFLQAWALWDLPKYSIMQFAHPNALRQFSSKKVCLHSVGHAVQSHVKDVSKQYWLFNDPGVATRVLGKPGQRRWFELAFVGPHVVSRVVQDRRQHGNSLDALTPHLQKNSYIPTKHS